MNKELLTKKQLIEELEDLRKQVVELRETETKRERPKEMLRESEEKYRQLVSTTTDAIMVFDADTKQFIEVNTACEDLYGYSREEFLKLKHKDITAEPKKSEDSINKTLQGKLQRIPIRYHKKKDGTVFPVEISASSFKLGGRRVLCGVIRDITERKQAEETFRQSENKYRILIENLPQKIFLKDRNSVYISCNENYARDLKITPGEIIGKTDYEFYPKELAEKYRADDKRIMGSGNIEELEERYIQNGREVWVHTVKTPIKDEKGNTVGILGIFWDITERRRAEEKIRLYQKQLKSLVSELSLTEERERRRLATELHDHIGQTLATTKIKLGVLRELTSANNLADTVDEIHELIGRAIQYTRSLTFELSPPILYELGLEAAVEWLAEEMQKQHGIIVDVRKDKHPKPLDDDIRVLLFLAIRELMLNIIKHAKARKAKVSIQREGDTIRITVQDDGVGFDASEINSYLSRTGGFGLFSINERISHLGGRLEIESEPDNGTRVTLVAPLKVRKEIRNET